MDPNTTIKRAIIGPPAKRYLNGFSLACRRWHNIESWLKNFVIFRGSDQCCLKKCDFSGVGVGTDTLFTPPPLWIRACVKCQLKLILLLRHVCTLQQMQLVKSSNRKISAKLENQASDVFKALYYAWKSCIFLVGSGTGKISSDVLTTMLHGC